MPGPPSRHGARAPGGGEAKCAPGMAKFCFVIHPLSLEDVVRFYAERDTTTNEVLTTELP